jgi:hypothetical protein
MRGNMMCAVTCLTFACLTLAACSGGGSAPDNAVSNAVTSLTTDTETAPADNVANASAADAGKLDTYIGKYPFDTVNGIRFYDQAIVKAAVAKAVPDKVIAALVIDPAAGPADMVFGQDGRVGAWSCEQHNCGDHQWTVLVDPVKAQALVCYHDAETMQGQSRWYDGTGGSAMRAGAECPSGENPAG